MLESIFKYQHGLTFHKYGKLLLPGSFEIEKSSRLGSRVKVDGSIEVGGGNAGGPPSEVADIMEAAWLTEGLR